jgi:hypothetical protein
MINRTSNNFFMQTLYNENGACSNITVGHVPSVVVDLRGLRVCKLAGA